MSTKIKLTAKDAGYVGYKFVASQAMVPHVMQVEECYNYYMEKERDSVTFTADHSDSGITAYSVTYSVVNDWLLRDDRNAMFQPFLHLAASKIVRKSFFEDSIVLGYASKNPSALAKKIMTTSYKTMYLDMINTYPHLDMVTREAVERGDIEEKDPSKPSFSDCVQAEYLKDILKTCPTIEVRHRTIFKVKELKWEYSGSYQDKQNQLDEHLQCLTHLTKQQPIKQIEHFYTPSTLQQYRALCLMQSYTQAFDSCQYVALHDIPLEVIEKYVAKGTGLKSYVRSLFELNQDKDFRAGLCRRYFQLGADGLVSRRFAAYKLQARTEDNELWCISNTYNMSHLDVVVEDKVLQVAGTDKGIFKGQTYFNFSKTVYSNIYKESVDNLNTYC